MSRILVTGGDGLVGHAIQRLNLPNFVFITHKDADLTKFDETLKIIKDIHPEGVIHLAARVGGLGGNMAHLGEFYRSNILINTNVLECSRLIKVNKLMSFLSTCVYPDNIAFPLKEEAIHDGQPHPSNYGYSYAKRMLDVQSRAYRNEWGCNFITAIPTNMYGPNDNWNLEDGHAIPSLIHKCYLAKKNNTDFIVWGSGTPLREFLLSDDAAKLAVWALKYYEEETPINFSTGEEVTIKYLIETIVEKIGFMGKVIWDTSKSDGQYRKPADTSKLAKYLPNFEYTKIEQGIENTINWFVANYPYIRV